MMKYCPNVGCPFLIENNMVAEYEDDVDLCPDCGMALEEGAAPKMRLPDPEVEPAVVNDLLATLCTVETREDALYLKSRLDEQGVVVKIARRRQPIDEMLEDAADVSEEAEETLEFYDLRVLASVLGRANDLLDFILESDAAEEEAKEDEAAT
jgi:hypothetical protein